MKTSDLIKQAEESLAKEGNPYIEIEWSPMYYRAQGFFLGLMFGAGTPLLIATIFGK